MYSQAQHRRHPLRTVWQKLGYLFQRGYLLPGMIALFAMAKFADLAIDVSRYEAVTWVDTLVVQAIHLIDAPLLSKFFYGVTLLASLEIMPLIVAAAVCRLLALRQRWSVVYLLLATLGGWVNNALLKLAFVRHRPDLAAPLVEEVGYSFPSGHAMVGTCFYGALIYLVLQSRLPFPYKAPLVAALAGLILLIGFSRIYLGVHYPTDVLGGFWMGLSWLCISLLLMRRLGLGQYPYAARE